MAYVNGAAAHGPASATLIPPVVGDSQPAQPKSVEWMGKVRARLAEPFDPAEIKWRVTATATTQTKRGPQKRGQLVAYTDQRAYTDRLNEVFGEWGWTRTYNVQVAQNFERRSGGGRNQTAVSAKVVVVSTVTVHGLGSHTGVGEEWADDENAATRAEAQAFKRACACFGLGRYLYDLDKVWADLDQYNRPVQTPPLPGWARPAGSKRQPAQLRQGLVLEEAQGLVNELCSAVGAGLSQWALRTYGGATHPANIGFEKLKLVKGRLTDLANGIARLRRASERLSGERYAQICRELSLPSASIDDIPDRDALRKLVSMVETAESKTDCSPGAIAADVQLSYHSF